MKVLGIETSCDETAAAVVENGETLISNVVASSVDLHQAYGGVVPEIAARSHIESIVPVIEAAVSQSSDGSDPWTDIDAIAVTNGPGLGGSLLVGVMTARTLAILKEKPLYAVNHVAAHPYVNFLTRTSLPDYKLTSAAPAFPLLALIVSGGHSQLVLYKNHFDYEVLGRTNDDALGEAFDKVAKILGLPYPGGPSVSRKAKQGDSSFYRLPKANMQNKYDFSFSGLKTAVLRAAQTQIGQSYDFPSSKIADSLSEAQKANFAASFQRVALETVVDKTILAFNEYLPKSVVIAGGVAANTELREMLKNRLPITVEYPDIKLCTDNGAMIATYGYYLAVRNQPISDPYKVDIVPNKSM